MHLGVLLGVLLPISVALGAVTILASGSPHWPASKVTDCALPASKAVWPLCAVNNRRVRPSPRPFKGAPAPPVNALFQETGRKN
jgi:hypothetical protein